MSCRKCPCADATDAEIKEGSGGKVSSCKEAKAGGLCSIAQIGKACSLSCGTCDLSPSSLPAWATCADKSNEVITSIAYKYGRITPSGTYSCENAKMDGACTFQEAPNLCPITCNFCRTPSPWTWHDLSAHYCTASVQHCDPATRCGFPIKTSATCEVAAAELGYGKNVTIFNNEKAFPGCFVTLDKQLYFNDAVHATNSNFNFAKSLCKLNDVPPTVLKATSVAIEACGRNQTMPTYDIAPTQLDVVLRNRSLLRDCNPCALRLVGDGMAALSSKLGFGGDADLDLVIMGQSWAGHPQPKTVFDLNGFSLSMSAVSCFPKCPELANKRNASLCLQNLLLQNGKGPDGGVITVFGHLAADASLYIQSSVLQHNEAVNEGGMSLAGCAHHSIHPVPLVCLFSTQM